MLKALMKKKREEFRAGNGASVLSLLFFISLLPLLRVLFDTPLVTLVSLGPLFVAGIFMGPVCALSAFLGDYAQQANRFLEYLPLRRSAIWLASYLSGLALLCLVAVSLFWLQVLLFPWGFDMDVAGHGSHPDSLVVTYLLPGRFAVAASCGSLLFWVYCVTAFPAAYLDGKDAGASTVIGMMFGYGAVFLPCLFGAFLGRLDVLPSGLALAPVLLTSGVLYSAGSYALFALVPKHITPIRHALLGTGLFLAISGALLGQLYVKHLAWRDLDPSLPLRVEKVYRAQLAGEPNLVLADIDSCRSGRHCVSLDVEQGTYCDLGRGLEFLEVPDNNSGLLHFVRSPYPGVHSPYEYGLFASRAPGATWSRSFRIPPDRRMSRGLVQWLPDGNLLLYAAYSEEDQATYLYVGDSGGNLLRHFEIGGSADFLVNSVGQAVAIAPTETAGDGTALRTSASRQKPYMRIDVESGLIERFGLPGDVVYFAKDLHRVICLRTRVQNGRQYTSYCLVELPSLEERQILSEDECPPHEVTSQVEVVFDRSIATDGDEPTTFLRVNEAFDTALWLKQRVEGDYFRYSIVAVDLNTAEQRVVVPESATPRMPVVLTEGAEGMQIAVHRFTADQAGFAYAIGLQTYLCEIDSGQSVLLADNGAPMHGVDEAPQMPGGYPTAYSPSSRCVLRWADIWDDPFTQRLRFSAVEVFQRGQPVRLHTGQQPVRSVLWLDNQRIVVCGDDTIHLLDLAGEPPRQIFPPPGSAGSEGEAMEP